MINFRTFTLLFFGLSFTSFAIQSSDLALYLSFARDFVMNLNFKEGLDPYLYSRPDLKIIWMHEWLSHLFFYILFISFGPSGAILLKMALIAGLFTLTLKQEPRLRNNEFFWTSSFVIGTVAASFRFVERSSLFTDLALVALVSFLINQDSLRKKDWLKLAVFFAVWNQLHPGFPLGLFLVLLFLLNRGLNKNLNLKESALGFSLILGSLAIHPNLFTGVTYPFSFWFKDVSHLRLANFEWMPAYHPLFLTAPETWAFFLFSFLQIFAVLKSRKFLDLRVWYSVLALGLGLYSVRFIPFAVFTSLVALKPFSELSFIKPRPVLAKVFSVLLCGLAVKNFWLGYESSSGFRKPQWSWDSHFFPQETLAVFKQSPIAGRLYNTHELGSSLIWNQLGPVFHHGFVADVDFYNDEVRQVFKSQEKFLELAEKYQWTMLLVDKGNSYAYFHKILSPLPHWKIVAEDDAAYLIYNLPGR